MLRKHFFLLFSIALFIFISCQHPSADSSQEILSRFPPPFYTYKNNPPKAEVLALGRMLFYDPVLSRDSSIACGNCHKQQFAFSDAGRAFSLGVGDSVGQRNSPGIFNLLWNTSFMWDGGVNHLEVMPLAPINNHLEMAEKTASVIGKLQRNERYRTLFKTAFGIDSISSRDMLLALAQFLGSIVSGSSRYDRAQKGMEQLSPEELEGMQFFRQHCSQCHQGELFTDYSFRNNGLNSSFEKDEGRKRITLEEADAGKFKVPSLRNVALSAPYMHDGRFHTLNQVLEHYRQGVKHSATLDASLAQGIAMSEKEKKAVLAFLYSLSDYELINNPAYAAP